MIIIILISVLQGLDFCCDRKAIEEVCQAIRDVDEKLCELIREPKPYNREMVYPSIEEYINRFDRLRESLTKSTNLTLEVCQDIFNEQGANFMHIRFDRNDLINGFQWDEDGMKEYENWRGKTLDAWLKCERFIYNHTFEELF